MHAICSEFQVPPDIFLLISQFGHPHAVILIAFPLTFFLNPVIGTAAFLSVNFSEWLNGVIKW